MFLILDLVSSGMNHLQRHRINNLKPPLKISCDAAAGNYIYVSVFNSYQITARYSYITTSVLTLVSNVHKRDLTILFTIVTKFENPVIRNEVLISITYETSISASCL